MEMMDDIGMSGESGDEITDSKPSSKKSKSVKVKKSKKSAGDLESLDKEMDGDEGPKAETKAKKKDA